MSGCSHRVLRPGRIVPLVNMINKFKRIRLLVVGDLMLDRYLEGSVKRISPEAPVPVVNVTGERDTPGGAANVAMLAAALGAQVFAAGITGADEAGKRICALLDAGGVDCRAVTADPGRMTPVKTRIVSQRQQLLRVDRESIAPPDREQVQRFLSQVLPLVETCDGLIFSDYNKGLATADLVNPLFAAAATRDLPVAVDPKPVNLDLFRGVSLLTPNTAETEAAAGFSVRNDADLERAAAAICARWQPERLLVTRSELGMALFAGGSPGVYLPVEPREVYDVTGAGDMVIAVCTLAILAGADPVDAARLANCAAGLEVRHFGAVPVTAAELETAWREGAEWR